jgi:CheY-like chemotaxis protein
MATEYSGGVQAQGQSRGSAAAPSLEGLSDGTGSGASNGGVAAQAREHAEQSAAQGQSRVLVIESEVDVADRIIMLLEGQGYAVEIATDAPYGLMLVESFQPHCILLGAVSERMGGADFTRLLRNSPGFAGRQSITPILFLVDRAQMISQRFHAMRSTPMSDAIYKPIEDRELLEKVADKIAQSSPGPLP